MHPGKDNPRNSEGAFIKLKDGGILFAYSRFSGDDWNDHANANIHAIVSYDDGETWQDKGIILKKPAYARNMMCVSLLRMANGDLGLFYCQKSGEGDCRLHLSRSSDEGGSWAKSV